MELFKEKEEAEIINKNIDPEAGVSLQIANIEELDLDSLGTTTTNSIKKNIFKKNHMLSKNKDLYSDIEKVEEEFHSLPKIDEGILTDYLPDEIQETLVSIDEFLEFLDNEEKEL